MNAAPLGEPIAQAHCFLTELEQLKPDWMVATTQHWYGNDQNPAMRSHSLTSTPTCMQNYNLHYDTQIRSKRQRRH
jgi:hypothetical protein